MGLRKLNLDDTNVSIDDLKFRLSYDQNTNKIKVRVNENIKETISIVDDNLRHMWGCKTMDEQVNESGSLEYPCNFNRNFQKIF